VGIVIAVVAVALAGLGYYLWQANQGGAPPPRPVAGRPGGPASRPSGPGAAGAAAPAGGKVNWLVGVGGEVAGKTFLVGHRTVTVGRAPTNFIQIEDSEASRQHCQVVPGQGLLKVIDMRSQNGIFVNDVPMAVGELKPGDVLRIGAAAFRYEQRADYATDDSLGRKSAGAAAAAETAMTDEDHIGKLVVAALEACHGDVELAAEKLRLPVATVRERLAKQGIQV
jgi:hypothetical protein